MIMPSSNDNPAGPGAKRNREVVTLHQGGVHLTLRSRSRSVALRMPIPNSSPKSRALSMSPLNVPTITSCKTAKQTLQGLVARGDVSKSFVAPFTTPHWRTMKICASQMALAILREASLPPPGDFVAQQDVIKELTMLGQPFLAPLEDRMPHIPRIIVTPPDECFTFINTVPTPQNSAFGMQLTVPNPEYGVINRINPQNPFSDHFHIENCPTNPYILYEMDAGEENSQIRDHTSGYPPVEDEYGDDEDEALDLGHTWSG